MSEEDVNIEAGTMGLRMPFAVECHQHQDAKRRKHSSMAASSCASRPAMLSCGNSSTSMSGVTPAFSILRPSTVLYADTGTQSVLPSKRSFVT